MPQSTVVHNTFVLERSYPVSPARVFTAFGDPLQKRRWFVDGEGHEVEHYELDFRVGGFERARFRFGPGTPVAGLACANDAICLDLVPDNRIVLASTMTINEKCISASLATFELLPTATGTNLIFTHQAAFFEGSDGPELRELGWRALFDRLTAELSRS